jgi:hypothetical protein
VMRARMESTSSTTLSLHTTEEKDQHWRPVYCAACRQMRAPVQCHRVCC